MFELSLKWHQVITLAHCFLRHMTTLKICKLLHILIIDIFLVKFSLGGYHRISVVRSQNPFKYFLRFSAIRQQANLSQSWPKTNNALIFILIWGFIFFFKTQKSHVPSQNALHMARTHHCIQEVELYLQIPQSSHLCLFYDMDILHPSIDM